MRDGFYGSQLIASLDGAITVVNASMARQFISSYEWMWARPSGCKLPGCTPAGPIPDGIFPQACTLHLPPAKQTPHCDYGQGGVPNLDLDTCAFAVKSLHVGYKVLGGDALTPESKAFFDKYKAAMVKSLATTTKDPAGSGLLYSNTSAPMVGYGFQDAEVKSGCVLYSSILYWNATKLMHKMATDTGDTALAASMLAEADKVQKAATKILWNDELGVFMASTGLERNNVDIWANAMAGAMGFATAAQDAKMFRYFQENEDKIFYEGQVIPPVPSSFTLLRPYISPVFPRLFPFFARLGDTAPTSPKPEPRAKKQPARGPRAENSALRSARQMLTNGSTGGVTQRIGLSDAGSLSKTCLIAGTQTWPGCSGIIWVVTASGILPGGNTHLLKKEYHHPNCKSVLPQQKKPSQD